MTLVAQSILRLQKHLDILLLSRWVKQEQRTGVIDQLLNNANKQDEDTKVEVVQVTEVTPAE
jgi:F0F1-type ATP synthase delta subunit